MISAIFHGLKMAFFTAIALTALLSIVPLTMWIFDNPAIAFLASIVIMFTVIVGFGAGIERYHKQ